VLFFNKVFFLKLEAFLNARKLGCTSYFISPFLQAREFLYFARVKMKVISLFSGIGGLDLGLEQAGHEVILQVENDPHCLQVLQRHFPGREIRQDVAELAELPAEAELLAAGFPCEVRHIPINFVFLSYSFKGCEHNEPKPTRTPGQPHCTMLSYISLTS